MMSREMEATYRALPEVARRLGLAGVGVVAAHPDPALAWWLEERLRDGTYPAYCSRQVPDRADPARWLAGCQSVWIAALPYRPTVLPRGTRDRSARSGPFGRLAAYALGEDYHLRMRRILRALVRWAARRTGARTRDFRIMVDTGHPVERRLWHLSEAGWIGKNTCAFAPRAGSWIVLGAVATRLPPPPGAPDPATKAWPPAEPEACRGCSRCVDACPSGALAPYRMDPARCIAQVSTRTGHLEEPWRRRLHGWLAGCDVCQAVCPRNRPDEAPLAFAVHTPGPPGMEGGRIPLADVLAMDTSTFRGRLGHTALTWRGLRLLQRNAAYQAGHLLRLSRLDGHERADLARALEGVAQAPSPIVAEAARWALFGVEGSESGPLTLANPQADPPRAAPLRAPCRTRPSAAPSPPAGTTPGR